MLQPTERAADFIAANDKSKVISGAMHGLGNRGGVYTLADGRKFDLDREDCRSLPIDYPKWEL